MTHIFHSREERLTRSLAKARLYIFFATPIIYVSDLMAHQKTKRYEPIKKSHSLRKAIVNKATVKNGQISISFILSQTVTTSKNVQKSFEKLTGLNESKKQFRKTIEKKEEGS